MLPPGTGDISCRGLPAVVAGSGRDGGVTLVWGVSELNFKFYRQATNKIAGISDGAAAFLDGFF